MWFNPALVIQIGPFMTCDCKFDVTYGLSNDVIHNSMWHLYYLVSHDSGDCDTSAALWHVHRSSMWHVHRSSMWHVNCWVTCESVQCNIYPLSSMWRLNPLVAHNPVQCDTSTIKWHVTQWKCEWHVSCVKMWLTIPGDVLIDIGLLAQCDMMVLEWRMWHHVTPRSTHDAHSAFSKKLSQLAVM